MKRNVLLLEPNYKNKYPPIGLMKLATYHRKLGDNVVFYKGDFRSFILNQIVEELIKKLIEIDDFVDWRKQHEKLIEYLKTSNKELLEDLGRLSKYEILISNWLVHYKNYFRKKEYINDPHWDRVCITTLFTFHWKITIETIEFAKTIVKDVSEIKIGGVLATVLSKELEDVTGIKPHEGLLDQNGILDENKIIIDNLPLDYSILDEIEYKYPENNAYYGYMTRGCIRKCSFCAVPKLEPKFQDYVPLTNQIKEAANIYGEKRNLLLLDNNVLASNCFSKIISEIKESGFTKDSKYIEPNQLDIAINNLKAGFNDRANIKRAFHTIHQLLKKLKGAEQQNLYNLMESYDLILLHTTSKNNVLAIYPEISDLFEAHRNKAPKQRYVDFNQGVDARLLVKDEMKMKLLSEIPIRPLRIAFDRLANQPEYVKSVKLAAKYGIRKLSNYLLYNEKDTPIELYQRLKINIDLCEDLDIDIYSFPMKYLPINGKEWYANRKFIGENWNRKFIRAIQTILNATKGKIGKGKSFFLEAFGRNEDDFMKLLYMPEVYILYRFFFKDSGYTAQWWNEFNDFSSDESTILKKIIESNEFQNIDELKCSNKSKQFLKDHYLVSRESFKNPNSKLYKEKQIYDASKLEK